MSLTGNAANIFSSEDERTDGRDVAALDGEDEEEYGNRRGHGWVEGRPKRGVRDETVPQQSHPCRMTAKTAEAKLCIM